MKDALNENTARIEAGPDAPAVVTCLACGGAVVLRSSVLEYTTVPETKQEPR
jgi:hypothetical protein